MAARAEENARESIENMEASLSAENDVAPSAENLGEKTAPPSKKRRWTGIIARILVAVFAIAALVLLCSEKWLFNNWAALSIDEIMYHLRASLSGTNSTTIINYISVYGVVELIGAAIIIAALAITRKRCTLKIQRIVIAAILAFGVGAVWHAVADFDSRVGASNYFAHLAHQTTDTRSAQSEDAAQGSAEVQPNDFIADNYVDPDQVALAFPDQKRNLIFIYLESMELTFADEEHGGAFPDNVIPELCTLAEEGECFAGYDGPLNGGYALPGTTWTTGAMFGSTSGAPLKLPINSSELSSQDDFFPTMATLGDILQDEGYAQELMIGSEASFGGRDLYYKEHGDYRILDYDYALENELIPPDYWVWWGFEDQKLFSFARDELLELAEGDQPFNFTMLTVDTHFPDGWTCPLCWDEFDDQYSTVFACSSRQVASFVRWIQQQDFYWNTTIVIMGDHPTMDPNYCNDVPQDYDRLVYTAIINPADEALSSFDPSQRRIYSSLDMFPTILSALGAEIDGNRLGLGANLFANEPTIVEQFGLDTCLDELEKPSAFLTEFTDVRITAQHMKAAASRDQLEVQTEEDGTLTFRLAEKAINPDAVNDVKIKVSDARTGFSRVLATTKRSDVNDPNVCYYEVHTNLTEDDLPHLSLSAMMSAGRFKSYPLCTWEPPEDDESDSNPEDETDQSDQSDDESDSAPEEETDSPDQNDDE